MEISFGSINWWHFLFNISAGLVVSLVIIKMLLDSSKTSDEIVAPIIIGGGIGIIFFSIYRIYNIPINGWDVIIGILTGVCLILIAYSKEIKKLLPDKSNPSDS